MSSNFLSAAATVLLLASTSVVGAQPVEPSGTDAAVIASDAAAAAHPGGRSGMDYRSAFDGYRAYSDQPVGSWRQANDLVGQIGGWKAYAREGQAGETAPADAPQKEAQTEMPRPMSPAGASPGSAPAAKLPAPQRADRSAAPSSDSHSNHH